MAATYMLGASSWLQLVLFFPFEFGRVACTDYRLALVVQWLKPTISFNACKMTKSRPSRSKDPKYSAVAFRFQVSTLLLGLIGQDECMVPDVRRIMISGASCYDLPSEKVWRIRKVDRTQSQSQHGGKGSLAHLRQHMCFT